MARRTPQSNYFADDKDIYDLLSSAKKKLPAQALVDVASKRGIYLSVDDPRESLIDQITLFPFGWSGLNELIETTEIAERQEKLTSKRITGTITAATLQQAIDVVKGARQNRDESYIFSQFPKVVRVKVAYTELDASRTRLVQRTRREATFEFDLATHDGCIVVRHEDQPRAKEILKEIVDAISNIVSSTHDTEVALTGIRDPKARTAFFITLIANLRNFKLRNVTSVKASRLRTDRYPGEATEVDEFDHSDEDSDEDSEEVEDSDDSDGSEEAEAEAEFVSRVKDIVLAGDGLLNSPQYVQLSSDGFFVRSIKWVSEETQGDENRVEFEAGFGDPENGTGFSYHVRGVYERKKDGDFRKTKSMPGPAEKTRLIRLIEDAAHDALESVKSTDSDE